MNLPSKLKVSYAKFWKNKSINITEYDPDFNVIYLGNVIASWAKGDGCSDKPLWTLWRNYTLTNKKEIFMRLTVCSSGLKAVTEEHGLTEYWAQKITFCVSDPKFPKVFCWIYRHDGRKMKQELRCHAVLCKSQSKAKRLETTLRNRLHQALMDFKREKIFRQNARLSLANSADEYPTMPKRKILLLNGSFNYRRPNAEASKRLKLKVIEECSDEEDDDAICIDPGSNLRQEHWPGHIYNELMRTTSVSYPDISVDPLSDDDDDVVIDYLIARDTLGNSDEGDNCSNRTYSRLSPHEEICLSSPTVKGITAQDSKNHDQPDAISDESGYSEESALILNSQVEKFSSDIERLNLDPSNDPANVSVDMSVQGVRLTDFTSFERQRYLSVFEQIGKNPDLENSSVEFCINI